MNNKILTINHLEKYYHDISGEVKAINDINFDVYEHEFVSIIGPSGCGKSTILSILSNLENKSSGNIKFLKNKCQVAYMLQQDSLFPWLSILDNCLLGLKIKGELNETNKNKILRMLNNYGLKDFIYKYPNSLSGGMRQRVALIRTLAVNPDILLLDEPFSALDYCTRLSLSDDLYNIIKTEGKTVIMVTHDLAEAISLSDRIIVLSNRPSKVKSIYRIELTDKKNPIHNRKCKEFSSYYELLWREIDVHI